ncbi:hypothetical protein Vretimale_16091 [Volvox reticuliferus]|nr:hypothetical protein Vretifemale_9660 [Volvox reticuliferus]GIM12879.1 hypothetical protein Vretimale_16091 [Volvox reticuliferus]
MWRIVRGIASVSAHLRRILLSSVGTLPLPVSSTPSSSSSSALRETSSSLWTLNATTDAAADAAVSEPAGAAATAATSATTNTFDSAATPFLDSLPADAACWASVSLVQMLLGFVLPTCLVYVLERSSREHFLKKGYRLAGGGSSSATINNSDRRLSDSGNDSSRRSNETCSTSGIALVAGHEVSDTVDGSANAGGMKLRRRVQYSKQEPSHLGPEHQEGQQPPPPVEPGQQGRIPTATQAGNAAAAAAARPPLPPPPPQLDPQTLQRLHYYQHQDLIDGWDPCAALQRGVGLLLASLLVLMLWELQLYVRLLGPMLLPGSGVGRPT